MSTQPKSAYGSSQNATFSLGKSNNAYMVKDQPSGSRNRTLILDLGDVLFHWSARDITALPPSTFKAVILSPAWIELECGRLSEDEAVKIISQELSLQLQTIYEALSQCRESLYVNHELVAELKALKSETTGYLKVYAMTNISKDDFARLKIILPDWDLFDGEFTSFEAGMTKPELGYYKHVLDNIELSDPNTAIYVDDKVVNVNAARSFGVHGIVFVSPGDLIRQLRNQLLDPVARGRQYLNDNARNLHSRIENGPEVRDVFSQFLIHSVLQDTNIISLSPPTASTVEIEAELAQAAIKAQTWNYFIDAPIGTTNIFPDDVDDTANALLAFSPPAVSANAILDAMLANRHSKDGLSLTYFDEKRPRVCPFVLVNVVRVFYHYNRGADISRELEHVRRILMNHGYVDGTDTYLSGEPFLYFLACLITENPDSPEVQSLREQTVAALRTYVGRQGNSFAVAVRILACQALDVWCTSDVEHLKELPEADGGWEIGWVCRYGRSQKRIGSRGVSTAFAIKALEQDLKRSQSVRAS
jgi:FMN phosphatase YigB (HAD superfamily)